MILWYDRSYASVNTIYFLQLSPYVYFAKGYSRPPKTSITILITHDNILVTLVLFHMKIKWMHKMKLFNDIHSYLYWFKYQTFIKVICTSTPSILIRIWVLLIFWKLATNSFKIWKWLTLIVWFSMFMNVVLLFVVTEVANIISYYGFFTSHLSKNTKVTY